MSDPRRNLPRSLPDAPLPGRAFFLVCLLVGCDRSASPAVIGIPTLAELVGAPVVAQQVLDSMPGSPIFIVPNSVDNSSIPDPAASLPAAVTVAGRMVTIPHLVGVVGHAGSGDALIAAPVYNANEIVQIVPTGTSRELASAGPWTFALPPNDSLEGEFLARFAVERLHTRSVTIVYLTDAYGNGLRLGTALALRARGVRILDEVALPQCDPQAPASNTSIQLLGLLRRGMPDLVILATRNLETTCALQSMAQHRGLRFVAGDGNIIEPGTFNGVGDGADSLYVAAFWHPEKNTPESRDFVRRFERVVGRTPHAADAMNYDAIMTLATAIRTVGTDRDAVREYLNALGRSRPAIAGVTGPITFPRSNANLVILRRTLDQWIPVAFP